MKENNDDYQRELSERCIYLLSYLSNLIYLILSYLILSYLCSLLDVFEISPLMSSRCLQDVFKISSRCLQDVFKMSSPLSEKKAPPLSSL